MLYEPCPFCGARDIRSFDLLGGWFCGCASCGTLTRQCPSRDNAVALWNRRTLPHLTAHELPDREILPPRNLARYQAPAARLLERPNPMPIPPPPPDPTESIFSLYSELLEELGFDLVTLVRKFLDTPAEQTEDHAQYRTEMVELTNEFRRLRLTRNRLQVTQWRLNRQRPPADGGETARP